MRKTILFTSFLILLISCTKDRDTSWDSEYLVPIAETTIEVEDLLEGDFLVEKSDNSLHLIHEQVIYSLKDESFIIPDTVITKSFTLDQLVVSDKTIQQKITLGQINPALAILHGTTQNIPAQNMTNIDPVPVDASKFFQTATVESGFLDISIENELPVNLAKVVLELRNENDNSVIATETFTDISPGNTKSSSIPLDDKTINASLVGQIMELNTDPSPGPVLIDITKGAVITMSIRDLKTKSAIAAFPDQVVMEQDDPITMDFGDAQVKWLKVKSGTLRVDLYTSIRENLNIFFKVPSAKKNGISIEDNIVVPGATPGNPVHRTRDFDMAGYWIDYRGKDPEITDTVNTFHQILRVSLDSSGRQLPMSLDDSVSAYYGLIDIVPDYAIGYFGQSENNTGDETVIFDEFSTINGQIDFKDVDVSLKVSNAVGAGGTLKVNSISSYNSERKEEVNLITNAIPSTIQIVPALAEPLRPWEVEYKLDPGNSNINDFIGNLPDRLNYNIDLTINPNGNISNYKDFIYSESETKVSMSMDIPLNFRTSGIVIRDTVDLEISSEEENDKIKEGVLFLHIENGIPLELETAVILLNEDGTISDTLLDFGQPVSAATPDGTNPQITTPTKSIITIDVPPSKADILNNSTRVILQVRLKTPGSSTEHTKLYSGHSVKMKLIADFIYENTF
jgi:hypothetical protein